MRIPIVRASAEKLAIHPAFYVANLNISADVHIKQDGPPGEPELVKYDLNVSGAIVFDLLDAGAAQSPAGTLGSGLSG